MKFFSCQITICNIRLIILTFFLLLFGQKGVENDEGNAIRILKNMQEKNLICHASGNTAQPFVQGFYFYYLHPGPKVRFKAL